MIDAMTEAAFGIYSNLSLAQRAELAARILEVTAPVSQEYEASEENAATLQPATVAPLSGRTLAKLEGGSK